MRNLFSSDSKIYFIMNKIYQLIILNIIFILSCLPVITIGASLTALYGTTFKMIEGTEDKIINTFVNKFKQNFKPGTKICFMYGTLFLFFILFYYPINKIFTSNIIFYYLFMVIITLIILTTIYVFPMLAFFENNIFNIIVNSFSLALRHITVSITLFLIMLVMIIIIPFFVKSGFILWLAMGFSSTFYVCSFIFHTLFMKYI